jgi:hypothetical protein
VIRTATLGYGVHGSDYDVTEGSRLQGPARELGETCETLVKWDVETRLPTPFGEFRLRAYENELHDLTHLALLMSGLEEEENVLVRVHSACLTGTRSILCAATVVASWGRRCSAWPQRGKV